MLEGSIWVHLTLGDVSVNDRSTKLQKLTHKSKMEVNKDSVSSVN